LGVQSAAEYRRTKSHETLEHIALSPDDCESKLEFAGACETMQNSEKWAVLDSNRRPPACRAGALTN
jgi:hypothetical protein